MNILVTGCGSSIGFEIAKSLNDDPKDDITIVGTEISWWGVEFGKKNCDEVIRSVRCDEEGYEEALLGIIEDKKIDVVFVNTDGELEEIAKFRDKIAVPMTCPAGPTIDICINKLLTYQRLKDRISLPESIEVEGADDVARALEKYGAKIWLRSSVGAAGKGSIIITKVEHATSWMSYWKDMSGGIQKWVAHEYLPGRNYCWCSIFKDGELVTSSTGERLRYLLSNVSVSGVTGMISEGQIVKNDEVNEIAMLAVKTIDENATGIFSVDFKEDRHGRPILTEVNARHAFRPWMFVKAGVNFSQLFCEAVVRGKHIGLPKFDAGTVGVRVARIVDSEPVVQYPSQD